MDRIDSGSGSVKRTGRWVVPRRLEVHVASGKVMLDFTEAVAMHPAIQIDAYIRSGSLVIVTGPGMVVDATAVAVSSGEVKVRSPWGPQAPDSLREPPIWPAAGGAFPAVAAALNRHYGTSDDARGSTTLGLVPCPDPG